MKKTTSRRALAGLVCSLLLFSGVREALAGRVRIAVSYFENTSK